MSDRIFVVETISDGAEGHPYDEVLSIGVCSVDLESGDVQQVYGAVIKKDTKTLGKIKLDYAESHGLDVSLLHEGLPEEQVVREFKEIIRGAYVTSYDIRQEFTKYLENTPWNITLEAKILPSIMNRQPISFRCKSPEDEPDIIRKAYNKMFKRKDPAGLGKDGSAIALATMASHILINLYGREKYRLPQ